MTPSQPFSVEARTMMRYDANKKSDLVTYLLWFFLGTLAIHRFYLGRIGSGIVMLLLFLLSSLLTIIGIGFLGLAVFGLWWLIDAFLIPGMVRDYNNRLISSLA